MKFLFIFLALLACVYAQDVCAEGLFGSDCSCTANVLEFVSTAECAENRWTILGNLTIDDRRTLNVSFDSITINGSLILGGENAAIQYSIDLEGGRYGFMTIGADANYGKGKLNVDFTSMPVGNWTQYLAQYKTRSVGFGSNNLFTYPKTEQLCRELPGERNPLISYDSRMFVSILIVDKANCNLNNLVPGSRYWVFQTFIAAGAIGLALGLFFIITCCAAKPKKQIWEKLEDD
jgi:hypothetical protein